MFQPFLLFFQPLFHSPFAFGFTTYFGLLPLSLSQFTISQEKLRSNCSLDMNSHWVSSRDNKFSTASFYSKGRNTSALWDQEEVQNPGAFQRPTLNGDTSYTLQVLIGHSWPRGVKSIGLPWLDRESFDSLT